MLKALGKISIQKRSIIIIVLILVIAITFETFQQLYYIKRFNLATDDVSFFSLLKTQSYRWLIWMILSVFLIWFTKVNAAKRKLRSVDFLKCTALILSLVFVSVFTIAVIQLLLVQDSFSITSLINDYLTFYTFQKAPIYILGYIAITIIMYLYFANEQLQVEVQELHHLKKTNSSLYNKLSSKIDDKTTILNIKIGNKRKIIPVDQISWIEADDYCVKVHTINDDAYTMRSSLKALEKKLNGNFLRVHRKAIVNMDMTRELNLSNTPCLILRNNIEILISKSNLKMVKDFLS